MKRNGTKVFYFNPNHNHFCGTDFGVFLHFENVTRAHEEISDQRLKSKMGKFISRNTTEQI